MGPNKAPEPPKGPQKGFQEGPKRALRGFQNVIMITDALVRLATTRMFLGTRLTNISIRRIK